MASLQNRTVSCQFESGTCANLFKDRSVIAKCQRRYFYKQPRYIVQPDKFRHFKPYFFKIVNNLSVKLKTKEIKLIRLLTVTVFEYLIWIGKKFTIKFRLFLFSSSFDWQDLSNTTGHTLPSIDPRPNYSGLRDLIMKTQQFPKICYFCLRKTWLEKPHGYRIIVFRQLAHWNAKPTFSNFSDLKRVFEMLRGKPNRRNRVTFLNFSSAVKTRPRCLQMW